LVTDACRKRKLEELLHQGKPMLVLVFDKKGSHGDYLARLVEDIARRVEPAITVVRVDTECSDARDLVGEAPRIALFVEGHKIWEQIGFFYNASTDKRALSRGMLYALRRSGLSPSRLGIRLDFQ